MPVLALYINKPWCLLFSHSHLFHFHPLGTAQDSQGSPSELANLRAEQSRANGRGSFRFRMMALSRRMAAPVLVLMLLLVATEMGTTKVAEARYRYCQSQSHRFKGLCVSSTNCANVCHNEHFPGGECKMDAGTRKCFCKKLC